jgi:hypothetical protein
MEKTLELRLNANSNIEIRMNNAVVHEIPTERTISADTIYTVLDPSKGDVFLIQPLDTDLGPGKQNDVLRYFHGFFNDLIQAINQAQSNLFGTEDETDKNHE